jgi:hypothetical protein
LDWQGNLGWLKGHFSKTPFRNQVPLMLGTITILEILTGLLGALGVFEMLFFKSSTLILLSAEGSMITLLMLFFGQRIAKDYAGAANLVPYFIFSLISIFLLARF